MSWGKRRKKRFLTFLSLFLLLIVLVVVISFLGQDLVDELRGVDPKYVLVALVAYACVQLAWGIKYYITVRRRVRNAYFPYVLLANIVGNFVNVVTPSGRLAGEPVRARLISKRYGARYSTVFAATMMDKMSLSIGMLILLVPLLVYAFLMFEVPPLLKYFVAAFALAWVVIGLLIYLFFRNLTEKRTAFLGKGIFAVSKKFMKGKFRKRTYFLERMKKGVREFRSSFKKLSKNPLYMVLDIFLSMSLYIFRYVAAYMFFQAIGYPVDFLVVATAVHISFIIGLMSQLPGMIGVGESTLTGLYLAMGVKPAQAVTVSILSQLNMYVFEIGLGYLATFVVNMVNLRWPKKS